MATSAASTYDQLCAEHEWRVPERYNIAQDVCDKHPRDKPAMVWERYDGATRELNWGELQDLANQAANWLAEHGITRGDRVAVVLPPTPETAAVFFATWKLGAILLSMSVLYGDDGIESRIAPSFQVPKKIAAVSGVGGSTTATRSPASTPWSRRTCAAWLARSCSSPQFRSRRSPSKRSQTIAGLSRGCLSQTSCAML